MDAIYIIKGFQEYEFRNKILYRKSYRTKSISTKWQYRGERIINQISNNGVKGYLLTKNRKRSFYSLTQLKTKLIKKVI